MTCSNTNREKQTSLPKIIRPTDGDDIWHVKVFIFGEETLLRCGKLGFWFSKRASDPCSVPILTQKAVTANISTVSPHDIAYLYLANMARKRAAKRQLLLDHANNQLA